VTLSLPKLRGELSRIFNDVESNRSHADYTRLWASAYHSYASDVTDVSGDRATNLSRAKFQRILRFRSSGQARNFARQLDQAFVTYWTGTVFAVGIPPSPAAQCPSAGGSGIFSSEISAVVVSVAPQVLSRLLIPALAATTASNDEAVSKIAQAFHTATTTAVRVLITGLDTTPSPAGPLPITNLCTLF